MVVEVSLSGPNAALTKKHFSKRWQDDDVREVHVIVPSTFPIYVMKSARDHNYQLMAHDFIDGLRRCSRTDLDVYIYPPESEFLESHFFQIFNGPEASRLAERVCLSSLPECIEAHLVKVEQSVMPLNK
jgi:hypothetical protein